MGDRLDWKLEILVLVLTALMAQSASWLFSPTWRLLALLRYDRPGDYSLPESLGFCCRNISMVLGLVY